MELFELNIDNAVSTHKQITSVINASEVLLQNNVPANGNRVIDSNERSVSNALLEAKAKSKPLFLRATDNNLVSQYPVNVFNAAGTNIGLANNKEEFLSIWNNDSYNNLIGTLCGGENPYSFLIDFKPGKELDAVIGNPLSELDDNDDVSLADNSNETILYK